MNPTEKPTLILASRNRKKLREIAELLTGLDVVLVSAADFPAAPDVEETGQTFAENAALKAGTVACRHGPLDDRRRQRPGGRRARRRPRRLLGTLRRRAVERPAEQREAPDRSSATCPTSGGAPSSSAAWRWPIRKADIRVQVEGRCRGRLLHEPRGQSGFGYDPLFWIAEYHKTFAELTLAAKSVLSHRARAFEKLIPRLASLLAEIK